MDNYEKLKDFEVIEFDKIIIHKEDECPICYEYLKNYIILECNHKYCLKCLNRQIEHNLFKCPLCRIDIDDIRNSMTIYDKLKDNNNSLSRVNLLLQVENKIFYKKNKILNRKYQNLIIIFLTFLFVLYVYLYYDFKNYELTPIDNSNSTNSNNEYKNVLKLIDMFN